MNELHKEYEAIRLEIGDIHSRAWHIVKENIEIASLFKGWKVFYSPLEYKPKVMFIGINPGGGEEGIFDANHLDKGELEYLHYEYMLARETVAVFNIADRPEALYNAVKTNYYFIATTQESEFYKLTDFLGRKKEDLGELLLINARRWIKKLIEIIQPQTIICEGSNAFFNVTDLFDEGIRLTEEAQVTYVQEIDAHIIGYKRRYSTILNRDLLANLINKYVTP